MGAARPPVSRVFVPCGLIAAYTARPKFQCGYSVWAPVESNPMAEWPLMILCVTSYEKGQEFLRTCKQLGCRVLLLTVEKLRNANWPRETIDEMFFMPEELPLAELTNAVSYAARS